MTIQTYSCALYSTRSAMPHVFSIRAKSIRKFVVSKFAVSICLSFLVFFAGVTARAAQEQTLSELEVTLQAHPQLQALRHQSDANSELSEAALGLPDPVISFGINNLPFANPSFSEFIPTNKSIGIAQRIPNIGRRKARSSEAKAQSDELSLRHQQQLSLMRAQLVTLLLRRDQVQQQTSLAKEQDQKYTELSDVVKSEVGTGRSVVFRLAEIERERAEVSTELVNLANEMTMIESGLRYLLGQVPNTKIQPSSKPLPWSGNPKEFYSVALAQAQMRILDYGVDEAKAAWKPEWGAQLRYQQREAGANFGGDDFISAMVTVTVPFWSKRNQKPRLRAANARLEAAKSQYQESIRQAEVRYINLKSNYDAAKATVGVLNEKMIAVNEEIESQRINYESGQGFYSPVIDGEILLIKFKSDAVKERTRSEITATQMAALLMSNATANGSEVEK